MKYCLVILFWLPAVAAFAQWNPSDVVPTDERERFRNPDGSCVQCSMCMSGVDYNVPAAEYLLEGHPEYGPPVRGGSWPERVKRYCAERGIEAWHIEGSQTMDWIDWACRTGRPVAVTLTTAHMQWLAGGDDYDSQGRPQTLYVVDNNSPQRVDEWDRRRFIQQHTIHGGGWCVVLKGEPIVDGVESIRPVPWIAPDFVEWWKNKNRRYKHDQDRNRSVASLFGR